MFAKIRSVIFFGLVICHGLLKSEDLINKITSFSNQDGVVENNASVYSYAVLAKIAQNFKQESDPISYQDKQVSKKDLILLSTLEWLDNIESLKNKNDQSLVNTLVTPVEFYQGRLKEHLESMAKAMGSGRDDVARIEEEASSLFFESDGTLKIKATRATKSAELFSEIKSAVTNELRNKFERGGFFAFLAKIFPFLKNKPSFSQVLDKISKSPELNVVGDSTGAPSRIRENLKNKIPEVKNIEEPAKASQPASSNTSVDKQTQAGTGSGLQTETLEKPTETPPVPRLNLPNSSDVDPADKPTQQEQVDPNADAVGDNPAESPGSSRSGLIVSTDYSDDREPETPVSTARADKATGQDLLRSNEAEGTRLTRPLSAPAILSTKDSQTTPTPPPSVRRNSDVIPEEGQGERLSLKPSFASTASEQSPPPSSRRSSVASSQGIGDNEQSVRSADANSLYRISSLPSVPRTNSSLSMKSGGFEDAQQFSDEEVKALQLDEIAQQLKDLEFGINDQGLSDELLTKNAQLIQTIDGLKNDEEFLKKLTVSEKAYLGHLDLQIKNISNLNLLKIMEEDAARASKDKKSFEARQESFVGLSKKVGIEVSEELFKKMAVELASPDSAGFSLGSKQSVSNDFVAHLKSMIADTQRNFLANEFIVQKFGDVSSSEKVAEREKFVAAFDKALADAGTDQAKQQKKLNKLQGAVAISMQSLPAYADFDALNKNIATASAGMQNDLVLHSNLVGFPGWENLKYTPNNLRSTPAQNKKAKENLDADDQLQEDVLKHIFKASGMEYVVDPILNAEARITKNRMTADALRIDLDSPQWLQLQKQVLGKNDEEKLAIFDDFLIGGKLDLKSFGESKFSQKFVKYFNDSAVDPSTIPSFNPQAKANISTARAKLRTALLGYDLADQIPTDAARHKAGSALMNLSGKSGWMLDLEQEKALNAFIDQVASSGVDIYDQQVVENAVKQKMFDKLASLEDDETVKAFVDGAQSYSDQKLKEQLKRDLFNAYTASSADVKPFWSDSDIEAQISSAANYRPGYNLLDGQSAATYDEVEKLSSDNKKMIDDRLDEAVNNILQDDNLKEKIFAKYTESKAINAVQIAGKTIDFEDFKAHLESKPEELLKLSKKIGSVEPSVVDLVKAAVKKTEIGSDQKTKFTTGLANLSAALENKDKNKVLDFVHKDCFVVQLDHVARKVAKLTFAGASTTSLATFNSEPFKKYLSKIKTTLSDDLKSNKNKDAEGASDEVRFQRLAQLNEIADESLRSEKKGTDYFLDKVVPRDKNTGEFEYKLSFADGLNKILELEVTDRDRLDILDLQKKEKVQPLIQAQSDAPGYPRLKLPEEVNILKKVDNTKEGLGSEPKNIGLDRRGSANGLGVPEGQSAKRIANSPEKEQAAEKILRFVRAKNFRGTRTLP